VVAGRLVDEDPAEALRHARAARATAARVPAVREAAGIAAYLAGEYAEALAELRTVRRMTGTDDHLAVLADCERALGRPERALELWRSGETAKLDAAARAELLIVAAGARRDLGQPETAATMLRVRELAAPPAPHVARLRYALAECLLELGRETEAAEWFVRAADADEDGATDAAERALAAQGVTLDDEDDEEDDEGEAEDLAADDEMMDDEKKEDVAAEGERA
jgi:tetratricopeptide (TPR) repeat protein